MRVERIEIEGTSPIAGVFAFPTDALGLWFASNDVPEGALLEAVACALYGPGVWSAEGPPFTRVRLWLRRDDGSQVAIDRSLAVGLLDLSGNGAADLAEEGPGSEIGTQLFGIGREDFVLAAGVRSQDLRATITHPRLPRLLSRTPSENLEFGPTTDPVSTWAPEAPDFAISRSPFEPERRGRSTALDDATALVASARSAAPTEESNSVERLRQLRRELATVEQNLAIRSDELHEVSERREELRAERSRLGLLADAEPADLDRLSELADLLVATLRRRDELTRERGVFEQSLAGQELDIAGLQELEGRYASLSQADCDLLASAEQATTIRRGNLALTRSECRLDDSRLLEITKARAGVTRTVIVPLVVAAVGLFASLGTLAFHVHRLVSGGLLLLGLGGGAISAWTFWRARTLREEERVALVQAQGRKRSQIAELEAEGQEADHRLAALGSRLGIASARALRQDWQRWQAAAPAVREFSGFAKRTVEIEEQVVGLRGKLGAFHFGGESEKDVDLGALHAMIEDYGRSFEMRGEIAESDGRAARLEADLAALESERSDIRMWIDSMLVEAGIDPSRDLDEAVEMYALRLPRGRNEGTSDDEAASAASSGVDADDLPSLRSTPTPREPIDTSWIPRVSAAAEAVVRVFLPEARELEVDERLGWTLRLDSRGPRLAPGQLEQLLSSAAVDQVCLALRLAIVETLSSARERLPVFLDEPWARADDVRHARGMEFLVEDLATRGQVVLRTSHEVRTKWFLHQSPALRDRVVVVGPFAPQATPPPASSASLSPSSTPH